MKPLSYPMKRCLLAQLAGKGTHSHCRTQADYGGMASVIMALKSRGLIDWDT